VRKPAGEPPLRRDARRNREAILRAARELFAEAGDVAMYEVARRAGVGQATLYRNFPGRRALATALFAEHLADLERLAAEHAGDPAALLALLRALVTMQTRFHGLVDCLDGDDARPDLALLRPSVRELLRPALHDAKAAALVRADLTLDDVVLVLAMVDGALRRETDAAGRAAAASRVLELAVGGLATRER
jgi:AcrR family transcriptional regulator